MNVYSAETIAKAEFLAKKVRKETDSSNDDWELFQNPLRDRDLADEQGVFIQSD